MGKMETKKKKKGRPSLLDLHKRNLKLQHQQQQQQKHQPPNSTPPPRNHQDSSLRRSARRSNPAAEDDGGAQLEDNRRQKKKLKPSNSDSGSEGNSSATAANPKRTSINSGSGIPNSQKLDKSVSESNQEDNVGDSGSFTPLPDKKLLLFILERLQRWGFLLACSYTSELLISSFLPGKWLVVFHVLILCCSKDTYGAFSEPVDPEELPDYHEIVDNPMDFMTLTKKLNEGVYSSLEQFEKDVFLICSNAMEYNASDTIYYRQARAIEELAKKNFENLRQDSDDNNEQTNKIVRRGRPPKVKRKPGRPALRRGASELSSDGTPASTKEGATRSNADLGKKLMSSENSGFQERSGQYNSAHDESALNKLDKNRETTGSILKGNFNSLKHMKGLFLFDEDRRSTYMQFLESANAREPPVLTTILSERKQLMAVGLLTEYGYPRSLARFAANAGSIVWRVASAKIQRSLAPGVKFGPGWVGENDIPQQSPSLFSSSSSDLESSSQPHSVPAKSCSTNNLPSENHKHLSPVEETPAGSNLEQQPQQKGDSDTPEKPDIVEPYVNVDFRSPQSSTSTQADPAQPDLALQL
ncbi:Bromodomain and PHD finger-containing protein 3 [Linum perenne]